MISDKNKKPSQFTSISSTSIYEMIILFIAEYKGIFLIIGICMCVVSIIIYLMFRFCCVKHSNQKLFKSSSYPISSKNTRPAKYISSNNNTSNNKNRKRQTKPERKDMNVNNLNQQNDYYVVLIEKD